MTCPPGYHPVTVTKYRTVTSTVTVYQKQCQDVEETVPVQQTFNEPVTKCYYPPDSCTPVYKTEYVQSTRTVYVKKTVTKCQNVPVQQTVTKLVPYTVTECQPCPEGTRCGASGGAGRYIHPM